MTDKPKETFKTRKYGNITIREGDKGTNLIVLDVAPSKLTEDDVFWMDYYEKKGFVPVPKRVIENPRNRKQDWFKSHCSDEEWIQFEKVKKEGFTSAVKIDDDTKKPKVYKASYAAAVNWFYEQHPELEPKKKKGE